MRRSFAQVAANAAASERRACVSFLQGKVVEVERLRDRGRITAEEASLLNRRLDAVADAISQGLHL